MVQIRAPASIGNFGPGIDAFSLALRGLGDTITLEEADEDRITVTGPGAGSISTDWHQNVAGITLDALRLVGFTDAHFEVHIEKGQPARSGLGSSASSAGGAALAFHALYPELEMPPRDLVKAAAEGEAAAAGYHFDDVSAVILGGLAIVRIRDGEPILDRVQPPDDLHIALVAPDMRLATRDMRALLPTDVPHRDAVHNVGNAAALIHAFHTGDVRAIGAALDDRLSVPYRKPQLPFWDAALSAGRDAGALGVGLSGSGPAMFAVTDDAGQARLVAEAMAEAVRGTDQPCRTLTAVPEQEEPHIAVRLRHV